MADLPFGQPNEQRRQRLQDLVMFNADPRETER
jgi:hypothetical protein